MGDSGSSGSSGAGSNMDANPIVQLLGMTLKQDHFLETLVFFFCLATVKHVGGAKNRIDQVANVVARTLGHPGCGLLLPLLLGGLPGDVFNNGAIGLDTYLYIIAFAIFTNEVILKLLHSPLLNSALGIVLGLASAIVVGNAAGHGFEYAESKISGSILAGVIGGYLAVNGHDILMHGIKFFSHHQYGAEVLTGFFGSFLYLALTRYVHTSATVARVLLVLFRVSCDYVNYNHILSVCAQTVHLGGVGGGKRSRSKTPMRRRR